MRWPWREQGADAQTNPDRVTSLHDVGIDGVQRTDRNLHCQTGETQQRKCDQGDGDLNAHRVLADIQEAFDLQRLLPRAKTVLTPEEVTSLLL